MKRGKIIWKEGRKIVISGAGRVVLTLKGAGSWEDYFVTLMKMAWKRGKRENDRRGWDREWIKDALEIIRFEAKHGIKLSVDDAGEPVYEKVEG